ncbi:hypothetical protein [Sneathiella sp.]|uniref:hypothetical protein n=1 Tax=Sneathiella sp. TaxID=1964365 RepID=UPI0026179E54|nr:hypothetical protein [Sneathiella sp.]MDF2369056.1 hypothetical protein [Sneathiella sp.]
MLKTLAQATIIIATIIFLSSCNSSKSWNFQEEQNQAESQFDAGSVHIAVVGVTPWSRIAGKLNPDFRIDGSTALAQAIGVTSQTDVRFLEALNVSLAAGLPTSSKTSQSTTATTDGVSQTTSTVTKDKGPGTQPESTSNSLAGQNATALTPPGGGSDALGTNAYLAYPAAAALFQQVRLFTESIEMATRRHGHVPFVVQLKVSLVPYQRRLPYDAYSQIGFFGVEDDQCNSACTVKTTGSTNKQEGKLPYVIPLLAPDSFEFSEGSRTANATKQLQLALSALIQGFNAGVNVESLNSSLKSILARDTNSQLTISRNTDNVIQARIGATWQATVEYAMTPRNHDVFLLLLIPQSYMDQNDNRREECLAGDESKCPTVRLVTHTEFRDRKTGDVLSEERSDYPSKYKWFDKIWKQFGNDGVDTNSFDTFIYDLTDIIEKNDLQKFKERVDKADGCNKYEEGKSPKDPEEKMQCVNSDKIKGRYLELWITIAKNRSRFQINKATFQLPFPVEPELPEGTEPFMLVDNGKSAMTATIAGGKGLAKDKITAWIEIKGKNQQDKPTTKVVLANDVSVSGPENLQTLKFIFPSISAVGVKNIDSAKLNLRRVRIEANYEYKSASLLGVSDHVASDGTGGTPKAVEKKRYEEEGNYTKITYLKASEPVKKIAISATTTEIAVLDGGLGTVRIAIDRSKLEASLSEIVVKGATLSAINLVSPTPDKNKTVDKILNATDLSKPVILVEKVTVDLSLSGLVVGQDVTVSVQPKTGSKSSANAVSFKTRCQSKDCRG